MVYNKDAVTTSEISRTELAELYAAHWESMARTAKWLVGSRQVGEEIAQDAFIRLIEHWSTINDKGAVPAWLRRTVVNLSRSANRRSATGREKRELVQALTPVVDRSSEKLGTGLQDGPLSAAIAALPRRQRECVVLRFVHDLTVDQIASALGVSGGSVKTHLHRALSTLQTEQGSQTHD